MIKPIQYGLCLSRLVGGSWLTKVNLMRAVLYGADLRWADLRGADLYGADLRGAVLYGAGLWGANLRGAYLREADLRKAYLRGAIRWGGKEAAPLVCAMAEVGAPWDCIDYEWSGRDWDKPDDYDHWVGIAKLYMLGNESDS